jgi:SAM-dependent methyltransferase
MIGRFGLGGSSQVVEVASNDGYLLKGFVARGVPVLGIEPARNVAAVAIERGIPTRTDFFAAATAERLRGEGFAADLLLGNNVLAHVPDINDFAAGLNVLLKPAGVVTMEFPHLLRLIAGNQFDTIYHEHYSYLSLGTVERIFAAHGLTVFDVEELATHGGSLRIFAGHANDGRAVAPAVLELKQREAAFGLFGLARYGAFGEQVKATKRKLLRFLITARDEGKSVAGYGAPAKGNTLLNYCGIREDLLDYTVDRSPHKQGLFLPGTRIPIHPPARLGETKPDYVLILPWNLKDEVMEQMDGVRGWGGQFVVAIPEVRVYP